MEWVGFFIFKTKDWQSFYDSSVRQVSICIIFLKSHQKFFVFNLNLKFFFSFRDFYFSNSTKFTVLSQNCGFKRQTGVAGIEPAHMVLKTTVLPLNYTPFVFVCIDRIRGLSPSVVSYSKILSTFHLLELLRISLTATFPFSVDFF